MDIQQIIKERYRELPPDIQEAIRSNDLGEKFNVIADKHSLHVDQNGALQTETILIMLGLEPTSEYINNIERNLDVSRSEAIAISEDVNTEILGAIKNSLRKMQEQDEESGGTEESAEPEAPSSEPQIRLINLIKTPPDHSDIEKAGGFTIEKSAPASASPQYNEQGMDRASVLRSIEDKEEKPDHEPITMIDHLLSTPTNAPEKVEIKEPPVLAPPPEKKSYTKDPYREQF